jgi:hypothetical protein
MIVALGVSRLWRAAVFLALIPFDPSNVMKMFIAATQLPGMLDEFAIGIVLAKLFSTRFLEFYGHGGWFSYFTCNGRGFDSCAVMRLAAIPIDSAFT